MIAANYRKHPDAMALQLPLPFPHRLVWHTARPGSRILRTIRAARSAAFKLAGRIAYPVKAAAPAWWSQWKRQARNLAATVRNACMNLFGEVRVAVTTADTELLGFNYSARLDPARLDKAIDQAIASGNRYRERTLRMQREREQKDWRSFLRGCPRCENTWVRLLPSLDANAPRWPQCTACGASWHPDYYDQAKRELNEPDDD